MSFDVFLQRFDGGAPGIVDGDRVRAVLMSREFTGPDEFGVYDISFSDGVHVQFSAKGLADETDFDGCAFHVRSAKAAKARHQWRQEHESRARRSESVLRVFLKSMSPDVVRFVWEIATAGNMVILPAMDDFVPIMSSPGQAISLPSDLRHGYPHSVICGSAAELESLLTGGYSGWKIYRDQIADASL